MNELEVRFIRHATGSHMLTPDLIAGRCIDAELTDEGRKEADAKGEELDRRGIMPDYVASSSATRCTQTGMRILEAMEHAREEIDEVTDELLEMGHGEFEGRIKKEVYDEERQQQILRDGKNFALPGGESMNEVGKRGVDWLRTVQERFAAQSKLSIFAIAHAGLITHTVGTMLNWSQKESLKNLKMPPVAETRVTFDGKLWRVDYFAQALQEAQR